MPLNYAPIAFKSQVFLYINITKIDLIKFIKQYFSLKSGGLESFKMNLDNIKIGIIGLGYVGLPLAIAFSKKLPTLGFDINEEKINKIKQGIDPNNEYTKEELEESKLTVTNDETLIKDSNFLIIAVPTPLTESNQPDLEPLKSACKIIGRNLSKNSIIVNESTVYPGVTEDICLPILEKESNLKLEQDFGLGYSPERINPGDKEHTLENVTKVISATTKETLEKIEKVYKEIIKADLYKAKSIKVAESAKIMENIQRDLNIALINEFALIFNRMGIRTKDVLDAASTKWNFHRYYPSLVGGHCIPVDPYYMTHKAQSLGYHPEVILSGRRINDSIPKHISYLTIEALNRANKILKQSRILILGLTFKADINDSRNSKVVDLIKELEKFNIEIIGCEPNLSNEEVKKVFNIQNYQFEDINNNVDCTILVNENKEFKEITLEKLKNIMNSNPIIVDMKNFFDEQEAINKGFIYRYL